MTLRCARCGEENKSYARFCANCGNDLRGNDLRLEAQRLGSEGTKTLSGKGGSKTEVHSSDDPRIGLNIEGRYKILRVLGQGGMGRVYFAEQTLGQTKRSVAIKVLLPAGNAKPSEKVRERFYRECETVVQLSHPNTIRFYDFGSLPSGELYIVMEFVGGPTLANVIEQGSLSFERTARLMQQVAGSLAEAHKRGIVHRDLKPENILLEGEGDEEFAKVCDFGIARNAATERANQASPGGHRDLTGQGNLVGTPAYMSPEQFEGGNVDARSDIYSLGLVAYEMLFGERPFAAKTLVEWATAHLGLEPLPMSRFPQATQIPEAAKHAILRALKKDRTERFQDVRAFAKEFSSFVTAASTPQMPILAAPRGEADDLPESFRLKKTRGPLPWIVGAFVLGVGAFVVRAMIADPISPTTPDLFANDGGTDAANETSLGVDSASSGANAPTFEWFRVVQFESGSRDTALALGAPDGQCAALLPTGKMVFEWQGDDDFATNGTDAAELRVVVRDDGIPYRVDVAEVRHEYKNILSDALGEIDVDVDHGFSGTVRYVRIKNRSATREVCVDAVGRIR